MPLLSYEFKFQNILYILYVCRDFNALAVMSSCGMWDWNSDFTRDYSCNVPHVQGRHSNQYHSAMALVVFCLASKPCFKNLPRNYDTLKYIAKKPRGLEVALVDFKPDWRHCKYMNEVLLNWKKINLMLFFTCYPQCRGKYL